MNIFPRLSALFVVSVASVTLFACAAPASASDDAETTASTTQPLFETCEGTYTRPKADGTGPQTMTLERDHDGTCTANGLRIRDDRGASPVAAGEGFRGTWATDPNAFVLCSDQHCLQWQKSVGSSER